LYKTQLSTVTTQIIALTVDENMILDSKIYGTIFVEVFDKIIERVLIIDVDVRIRSGCAEAQSVQLLGEKVLCSEVFNSRSLLLVISRE